MSLSSEKIKDVKAFLLSAGNGRYLPGQLLVEWKSACNDKYHQVYINGRFAAVTDYYEQRQILIGLPASFESSVRIEVFAVEAKDAFSDFSNLLPNSKAKTGRILLKFLRGIHMPMDAQIIIYSDNGSGQVDYENPVGQITAWPDSKLTGFGLNDFGESGFGREWSGAAGFGTGSFGKGPFGADSDIIQWLSSQLSSGKYKFGIKITDSKGNISNSIETEQITVLPAAKGPECLTVHSFDETQNDLVLNIS